MHSVLKLMDVPYRFWYQSVVDVQATVAQDIFKDNLSGKDFVFGRQEIKVLSLSKTDKLKSLLCQWHGLTFAQAEIMHPALVRFCVITNFLPVYLFYPKAESIELPSVKQPVTNHQFFFFHLLLASIVIIHGLFFENIFHFDAPGIASFALIDHSFAYFTALNHIPQILESRDGELQSSAFLFLLHCYIVFENLSSPSWLAGITFRWVYALFLPART